MSGSDEEKQAETENEHDEHIERPDDPKSGDQSDTRSSAKNGSETGKPADDAPLSNDDTGDAGSADNTTTDESRHDSNGRSDYAGQQPESNSSQADDQEQIPELIEHLEQIDDRTSERLDDIEAKVSRNHERINELETGLEDHRRRSEKEREEIREYAVERFAQEMIQVKDSLETAIEVEEFDDSTAERLELLNREFGQALQKGNVEMINDPDAEFDSLRHKIVDKTQSPDHESNEIVEISEPGYKMDDRVLRPARVVLAI